MLITAAIALVIYSRQRSGPLGVMLITGAVLAAYVYFVSLYLQTVLELSPLLTGVSLLPATLTIVVLSSFVVRRVIAQIGLTFSKESPPKPASATPEAH